MSTKKKPEDEIVDAIIKDMTGRGGGDHWWESIDEEVRQEIRAKWAAIIAPHLGEEA